jgi:hypothetical protein
MISDVLSDVLDQIEECQACCPNICQETKAAIEEVIMAMARLLIRLDSPSEMTPERWAEEIVQIAECNPSGLKELIVQAVEESDAVGLCGRHGLISHSAGTHRKSPKIGSSPGPPFESNSNIWTPAQPFSRSPLSVVMSSALSVIVCHPSPGVSRNSLAYCVQPGANSRSCMMTPTVRSALTWTRNRNDAPSGPRHLGSPTLCQRALKTSQ